MQASQVIHGARQSIKKYIAFFFDKLVKCGGAPPPRTKVLGVLHRKISKDRFPTLSFQSFSSTDLLWDRLKAFWPRMVFLVLLILYWPLNWLRWPCRHQACSFYFCYDSIVDLNKEASRIAILIKSHVFNNSNVILIVLIAIKFVYYFLFFLDTYPHLGNIL